MKKLFLMNLLLVLIVSCGNTDTNDDGSTADPIAGVYISGSTSTDPDVRPIISKDGTATVLDSELVALTSSVFVTDNEVYMSGFYQDNSSDYRPCYWQGNVRTNLEATGSTSGKANSIYVVSGLTTTSDTEAASVVYVAGYYNVSGVGNQACYWRDGVLVDLGGGYAEAIFVSGSDVYVAGQDNSMKPVYWKNGVKTQLSTNPGDAFDIKVSDGNVHVVGWEHDSDFFAVYWKNGAKSILSATGSNALASSIYVDGADVYIAGTKDDYQKMVYWKNTSDNVTELDMGIYFPNDLSTCMYSYCLPKIMLNGGSIYIAGILTDGSDIAAGGYWKDGVLTSTEDYFYSR
jgi:hypothetical protein